MKEYFFYRGFDHTKEPIGKGRFISLMEAYELLAKQKNLPLSEFTKIFKVEKA